MEPISRRRWLVPAALALVAYVVGGRIEVASIDAGHGFDYAHTVIAHGTAVLLIGWAAFRYRSWVRTRPSEPAPGWRLPAWHGYGFMVVGAAFVALAIATWFLTPLKSPSLMIAFIGFGALGAALGVSVVREAQTGCNSTADRETDAR